MPKEHFDKTDRYIEYARNNPEARKSVEKGLRALFKSAERELGRVESNIEKFENQPELKGFEDIWRSARELQRTSKQKWSSILKQTKERLKRVRTSLRKHE